MNSYSYEEITVGMTESFTVQITEKKMEYFLELTGDMNPLHNQKDYAKEKGYKDRVVYGMLTASFLSTLAGIYLPGEKSLIHSVETKMIKPVFIGDELIVTGKVSEKSGSIPVITVKVTIENQNREIVMRGKMQIGVSS
jgi:3-hydroxybutyryl-CoA dehydratase